MFGLFGSNGKSADKAKGAGKKPSIDELRAQAMANARAARENIGEETLNRIAAAMAAKQSSVTERAKAQIKSHSIDDLARELRYLINEDRV